MNYFTSKKSNHDLRDEYNSLELESLEDRMMLSTVQIIASGAEGNEVMQLRIDNAVAQAWTVSNQVQTYTYNTANNVNADDVRIQFTNDLYDPDNGVDRNLVIDAIVIDGTRYETEDPGVFSTGTWRPEDGVAPGFRQEEVLHSNGYFQYAGNNGGNGTEVKVRARGDEGGEQFRLIIDGSTVQTFTTTTSYQTFTYNATGNIEPGDVRVEFFGDVYEPDQGIDKNLDVNYIRIDGTIYETEDPSVFSTGSWLPADGIQPGFRQSETLNSNGYFQWAGENNQDAGDLRLANSVYSVTESGGSIAVQIVRENGADGAVSLQYTTVNSSATAGQDYQSRSGTVSWADGQSGTRTITIPIINDSLVEGDEQFSFTIDNPTGNAQLLAPRTATITIDDNDSIDGTGDGLLGEYFNNSNLTNRVFVRTDNVIDFDWATGSPRSDVGVNTFSARWTGEVEARYSENYTFQTLSDDGIRLWVNDTLIIDQWNDHAATIHTGQIFLEAGIRNDIRLEYYENAGDAVAQLSWQSATQSLEVIPRSQLYAADNPGPDPGNNLVSETVLSGLSNPTSLEWTPDGQNMYVTQKDGRVKVVRNGNLQSQDFIDIRSIVNGTRDRGLLDIAVHPDFENTPYVYLLFTYDPPEVNNYTGLAGPDGNGNRAGRLIRVTADASNNYRTAVAGSEVVLLGTNSTWDNFNGFVNSTSDFDEPPAGILADGSNLRDFIASDSESHTIGGIDFGTDGNLFVSIGDGTSYNRVDPRTVRVQDIDNLSGKILRIDPITGQGVSDNPFYNGDPNANRSKVYQLGLRNPFRITVNPNDGQLFIGDVGWTQWEEVNAGGPGDNFGWPYYEGGSDVSLRTNRYQDLPEAQTFYAANGDNQVTPSIYALNHSQSGINAIILGDVYTGTAYPAEYTGDLFFNDLGQGIVRNVSFDSNGNVSNVETFATGAQIVVHIQQGPDGNLYYIDLNDGQVGRWVFE